MISIAEIFRLCGTVLFCMLTLSAATMFDYLKKDILEMRMTGSKLDVLQILKWRRTHSRISSCVDGIHRSFGLILLIDVTFIFLRVTTSSFHAFLGIQEKKIDRFTIYQLMKIIELSFQFWIVCAVANKLRSEVRVTLQQKTR